MPKQFVGLRPLHASDAMASRAQAELRNLSLIDVGMTADEKSPFAGSGYKPDATKAYLEFEILHTLPEVLGPVEAGNYVGVTPATLAASHASLQHQQFNLGHKIKANATEAFPVARDHIIGAVVGTHYPNAPMGGFQAGQVVPIKAMAVIFKLADGVSKVMGEHLTGKKPQSVSIEMHTNVGNMGVHRPSTGETWPLIDLPEEVVSGALKFSKTSVVPTVGKLDGEQLVLVYGMGNPIHLKGVGMTPTPAERAARIVGVTAASRTTSWEEGTLVSISASAVEMELLDREVVFASGRKGVIDMVYKEGKGMAPNLSFALTASAEEPVVRVRLSPREWVLYYLTDLAEKLA